MKFWDKIKKGEPVKKEESVKEEPVKEKPKEKKVEKKAKESGERKKISKGRYGDAYKVLKQAHITEKATYLEEKDQYIFRVYPRANKVEIRKAVEHIYGVNVLNVRIINVPSKKRRMGRTQGRRSGYKKAIVKIKKGQKIELLPR